MATSLTMDRASMRQLAAAMAVIMTMATLPSIGVIVISDRSGPSISLDICHPLQSLDRPTNIVPVARPAPPEISARISSHETLAEFAPILTTKFVEAPDPPPPKPFR